MTNNLAKMSFSKTQKLDLKDTTKIIFNHSSYQTSNRDNSSEHRYKKDLKVSPIQDDKHQYANLLKANKEKNINSKRSRGSQDKYNGGS